jgi:predicted MFS family arabinose efflux permease
VPVSVLVLWAARHVPESRDPNAAATPDLAGAVLAAVGLGGVTYASIEWAAGAARAVGVAGVLALAAFLLVERRSDHPMLPLGLFASAQFSAANALTFVVYAALGGALFLLTVDLQQVLGYSALAAGAALLPLTLVMLAFSARSGALAARRGPRAQLIAGPLVIAAALAGMTSIGPDSRYVTGVLPHVVVFGAGLVLLVAPLTASVLAAVDVDHAGVASGVNNAVARAGGLLAVAVLPLVAGIRASDYDDPAAFSDGFRAAMWIAAGLAAAGALVAWAGIRRRPRTPSSAPTSCPLDGPPAVLTAPHHGAGRGAAP